MKNLLHISEQEKKNIMRMHGILNEEEDRNYDGSTWGYFTGDTGEKIYFDDDGLKIWMFETLTGKKIVPSRNRATIEVWSSGCDDEDKVCRNITKHKIEIEQKWNSKKNHFDLFSIFYYSNGDSSYISNINSDLVTYADPPRLKITTRDKQNLPFAIFGSEENARKYRNKKIKEGFKNESAMSDEIENKMTDCDKTPTKEQVNLIYSSGSYTDNNYRYLKQCNDWFARNIAKDGQVFNLSKKSRDNNDKYQSSIDNLEKALKNKDGKKLETDSSN